MTETKPPCARCGRPMSRTGRVVDGRRVCPSCAPRFNSVAPCPRCGKGTKIFGYDKDTGERVCNRCLARKTHATCRICGKYRRRSDQTRDGKPICVKCAERPDATHRCPQCHTEVPGDGQSLCMACATERRFHRVRRAQAERFSRPWARALFEGFTISDSFDRGQADVVADLAQVADQFLDLEAAFPSPAEFSQEALLACFGLEGVRKRQRMLGYLIAAAGLEWTNEASRSFKQRRTVALLLEEADSSGCGAVIGAYAEQLDPSLSGRTCIAYLRAALAFMQMQNGRPLAGIGDERVMGFHRQKPGYRASLAPFLSYLVRERGLKLAITLRKTPRSQCAEDRSLVRRVRAIRAALQASPPAPEARALVAALLAALYRSPLETVLELPAFAFRYDRGRLWVHLPEGRFRLAREVATWIEAYAITCAPGPAFPGRPKSRPLHPTSVLHHLRKHGLARRYRPRRAPRAEPYEHRFPE